VHILIEEMIDLRDTQRLFGEFVRLAEPLHRPGARAFRIRP
jgi:hypothetical protein